PTPTGSRVKKSCTQDWTPDTNTSNVSFNNTDTEQGGMMTTIVRRGQNRKAAEAKRAKHAQRTPLPTTKEIAPVIVKQRASDDLDKMSVSQLRQLARAQGWSLLDNVTKSQIVLALREHPGGAPADAQPLGTRKSVN